MRRAWTAVGALACLLVSACAAHRAAPARLGFDFSRLRRVEVLPIEGDGGEAGRQALVRQLLRAGYEVLNHGQEADAVIAGVMMDYRPSDKRMIFLGGAAAANANGEKFEITDPVLSGSGLPNASDGVAYSLPKSQMAAPLASVSLQIRVSAPGGAIVWRREASYEGLDPSVALDAVARILVASLPHAGTGGVLP